VRNPCKNCVVKGNCSIECKDHKKFQSNMAQVTALSTVAIFGVIVLVCVLYDIKLIGLFWISSFFISILIPKITADLNIFAHLILAPYLIITFLIALFMRKYVMRPVDYSKDKKKQFSKRILDLMF
jgi:hypothetical protein